MNRNNLLATKVPRLGSATGIHLTTKVTLNDEYQSKMLLNDHYYWYSTITHRGSILSQVKGDHAGDGINP